jgi:DNA processing protein
MSDVQQETLSSLVLTFIPNLGPQDIATILKNFTTATAAIENHAQWAIPVDGAQVTQARRLAEQEIQLTLQNNIRIFLLHQDDYPELLRHIHCPPPILYVKGGYVEWSKPAVALVGSRKCTYYGEKTARRFSSDLARAGVVTVSGLARGIDSAVHDATLQAGGKTWAVLGHGLSWLYPPDNKRLAEKIQENGALISEFPMQMQPYPGNFPRRNRIIAGLTRATVVVEGRDNSGSLITARMAAHEGRDVLAVPGPVSSDLSAAPHRLIQAGAILAHSVEDILNCLPADQRGTPCVHVSADLPPVALPEQWKSISQALSDIPLSREHLAQQLRLESRVLAGLLMEMELKGYLKSLPGGLVVKV